LVRIAPLARSRHTGNGHRAHGRQKPKPRDLSPLGVAELEAYIDELEAEIVRARNEIAAKRKQRGGAETLFKR
jgi:uncharacterized small protein (DUF1192 family)